MREDILSGYIGLVVKTQFFWCNYKQNKRQNILEQKLHFETIQIKQDKWNHENLANQVFRLVLTFHIIVTFSPMIAVFWVLIWIKMVVIQSY